VTEPLNASDRKAIESVVKSLETAWNAADGVAWGACFAADADFVTIRAEHFHGRDAIAGGHAGIFKTIYAGSVNHFTLDSARLIRPDVALVHVRAVLDVPAGPLSGRHNAVFSMVMTRTTSGWEIASFHNTLAP